MQLVFAAAFDIYFLYSFCCESPCGTGVPLPSLALYSACAYFFYSVVFALLHNVSSIRFENLVFFICWVLLAYHRQIVTRVFDLVSLCFCSHLSVIFTASCCSYSRSAALFFPPLIDLLQASGNKRHHASLAFLRQKQKLTCRSHTGMLFPLYVVFPPSGTWALMGRRRPSALGGQWWRRPRRAGWRTASVTLPSPRMNLNPNPCLTLPPSCQQTVTG